MMIPNFLYKVDMNEEALCLNNSIKIFIKLLLTSEKSHKHSYDILTVIKVSK